MSNWKVSKEKIELFTHSNADTLELGKVGTYQVVVQKGLYKSGDEVIFCPEKSVLSGDLKSQYEKYLAGPNNDRVKSVRLRGEISSGIIIPKDFVPNFDSYELGEHIDDLNITKYEPPIPMELMGKVRAFDMPHVGSHDCEHANIYINNLVQGERVVITEKVHGTQFILAYNFENDSTIISSKGMLKSGLSIDESDTNYYWVAAKNDNIIELIKSAYMEGIVQIFGEVIPVQKGYSYGQDKPTLRIFDVRLNSVSIPYDKVSDNLRELWVPIIYDGVINLIEKEIVLYENKELDILKTRIDFIFPSEIIEMCKGNELVSGKELHIREGFVLRPYVDRDSRDGTKLRLKVLNPAYKETGEEIN